jgi:hypothetical protein
MALEDISVHHNLIIFTDRTPDDFTARVALTIDDLGQVLDALDSDQYDLVIAMAEQKRARQRVIENLANRRADREERANRRKEMRQELRDSYAR